MIACPTIHQVKTQLINFLRCFLNKGQCHWGTVKKKSENVT